MKRIGFGLLAGILSIILASFTVYAKECENETRKHVITLRQSNKNDETKPFDVVLILNKDEHGRVQINIPAINQEFKEPGKLRTVAHRIPKKFRPKKTVNIFIEC